MLFALRISLCFLALSLSLICSAFPMAQSSSSAPPNVARSQAESDLRALVEKYFALYSSEDVDGLLRLWSQKAPDYTSLKPNLQREFATQDYSFGPPTISRIKVESERASLRATVNLTAINLKSNQKRERRMARNFDFVSEDGKWKVWRYAPAENDLAGALANAETEAEREKLLAEEAEIQTAELGQALLAQSRRLFSQGVYNRALVISELALKIAEPTGDKALTATVLRSIGNASYMQGDYTQALDRYHRSMKIFEELGDKAGIASILNNSANIHRSRGNYTEALEQLQKGLKIFEESGDKAGMANALNNIGLTHSMQGDYTEALEQFRKGLKISEEIGNKNVMASILSGIGGIHNLQGSYIQALEQYQKSLNIYKEIGNKGGIANLMNNIGNVHFLQGNHDQALERYQSGLEVSEEIGDRAGIGIALNNIGNVHGSQGDYVQALDQFQKSLKIKQEMGAQAGIASAFHNLGNVHVYQGDYAQAQERFQRSLKIYEGIGNKAGTAELLNAIGETYYLQDDHTQALQFAERAAALAGQIGASELFWRSRVTTGKAYLSLKQLGTARLAFEDAIATVETLRIQVAGGGQERQRFFESKVSPYHAMCELLIAQNNPREALSYAERAKADSACERATLGGADDDD